MQIKPKRKRRQSKKQNTVQWICFLLLFLFFCFYYLNSVCFLRTPFLTESKNVRAGKAAAGELHPILPLIPWQHWRPEKRCELPKVTQLRWSPWFWIPSAQSTNLRVSSKGCTMEHRLPRILEGVFWGTGARVGWGDRFCDQVRGKC